MIMIRNLLKWLACGFVVALGLALVNWDPAGVPAAKSQAEREGQPPFTVAGAETPATGGKRAQP